MKKLLFVFAVAITVSIMVSCSKKEYSKNEYSVVTDYVVQEGAIQIENNAFRDNKDMKTIIIPNSVKSIGKNAFINCSLLESVIFENGSQLLNIGDSAFAGCNNLKFFAIPEGVQRIGMAAFYECESLTSITIPQGVKEIQNSTFKNCKTIASVIIPEGVTCIGEYAFADCSGLTSVIIPNSVTNTDLRNVFCGCESLPVIDGIQYADGFFVALIDEERTSYRIPENVRGDIDGDNFLRCKNLTSPIFNKRLFVYMPDSCKGRYEIPNGIEIISSNAFFDCNLTSITIPNSVTIIGKYAFSFCPNLISVSIPNSVTSIGNGAFCDCEALTSVTIPNSVTSIGNYAFSGCTDLTSVTIPNSVKKIEGYAFWNCTSLSSMTIPNSVKCIEVGVFSGCKNLTLRIPKRFQGAESRCLDNCKEIIYY